MPYFAKPKPAGMQILLEVLALAATSANCWDGTIAPAKLVTGFFVIVLTNVMRRFSAEALQHPCSRHPNGLV